MTFRHAAFGAVIALVLAGCSGSAPEEERLPAARGLLRDAAEAMRAVETVHFDISAQGEISGLPIRSAEGVLTSEGEAEGTVELEQGESLVEFEFVVDGNFFYVKGATGGFQTIPRFLATSFYDPTKLLDPEQGLAELLDGARSGRTQAREEVAGADAYRVKATIDGPTLRDLIPLEDDEEDVPATMWISSEAAYLVQTRVSLELEGSRSDLTVTLSEFNAPVEIEPPE